MSCDELVGRDVFDGAGGERGQQGGRIGVDIFVRDMGPRCESL